MAKEKFLLVSLKEDQAKQLAQTLSNDTSRLILDYLADKESTESELAEKLNLPLSTVHYNLKQLQKGGLVVSEEYHYSKKGKEVSHYKLANKYIIIAPKSTYGIKEKLKSILPVALIIAVTGTVIQYFSNKTANFASSAKMLADEAFLEAAPLAAEAPPRVVETAVQLPQIQIALWFIGGAFLTIALYLLIDYLRNRKD